MVSRTQTSTHIKVQSLYTDLNEARRLSNDDHAVLIEGENSLIALSVEQAIETANQILDLCHLIKK
ncbi:hypothetical protein BTR23_07355 [Alkalihalophilus pseudofirmus]|nr:hypothetical protein BTR23_07355 [Alkalihalophilus pseudofirmus]